MDDTKPILNVVNNNAKAENSGPLSGFVDLQFISR